MLVDCPKCSAKISSAAAACPHCGFSRITEPRRGLVGGPVMPYQPETFSTLYIWAAIMWGLTVPFILINGISFAMDPHAYFESLDEFPESPGIIILGFIGWGIIITAVVLSCILLFKAWNQIQDGHQRTSAGQAVGFCFIPFFNFYWMFVAVYGLAQDLNAYARRYKISAPPVSEGLALISCILFLASFFTYWIPLIGLLVILGWYVIGFILWYQVRSASMAVARAKLQAAGATVGG